MKEKCPGCPIEEINRCGWDNNRLQNLQEFFRIRMQIELRRAEDADKQPVPVISHFDLLSQCNEHIYGIASLMDRRRFWFRICLDGANVKNIIYGFCHHSVGDSCLGRC